MSDYKFYTPVTLLESLLEYIPPDGIDSIIDLACGSFNLLKAAQKKYPNALCVGVDIDEQPIDQASGIQFIRHEGRSYAVEKAQQGETFGLLLTNPPYGRLRPEEQLFHGQNGAFLNSRYECEMLYANCLLSREGSWLIGILPSTFVEGDLYAKYRKHLAGVFEIVMLVKLPGDVFSRKEISSYAVIMHKNSCGNTSGATIGYARKNGKKWSISIEGRIEPAHICEGNWSKTENPNKKEKIGISFIGRGDISSKYFSSQGTRILHCSSNFIDGCWIPSERKCVDYPKGNLKYVERGDIIINRIGKYAGYWRKHTGEKCLVSDCLIVVRGNPNLEGFLNQKSSNGKLSIPVRGIATKYISMKDLLDMYFVLQVCEHHVELS